MTKVILILSLLTLLGAGGLAVVNRSTFVTTRTDKDKINATIDRIKGDYKKNFENQFVEVDQAIVDNKGALAAAKEKEVLASGSLSGVKKELELEKAKEAPLDEEIAEAQKGVDEFNQTFPGIDFDGLPAKIDEMETRERELRAEDEALRAENAIVTKKIETNTGVISRFVDKQVARTKGVARNASQPLITAVNEEWGFVVINAGKDAGMTNTSRILCTRNGQVICRLKIVTVEARMTVANIDRSTMAEGAAVLPGDQIIYQNLQD